MSEQKTYTLSNTASYQYSWATALCRTEHEGQTYVTGSDMCIYISFPFLDLSTGITHELWLTKDQIQNFEGTEKKALHPRTLYLPEIGLPTSNSKSLHGFSSEGNHISVLQDGGGHWWAGSWNHQYVQSYWTHPLNEKGPFQKKELRFCFPHLIYLGTDEGPLWIQRWASKNIDKDLVTIATYEVQEAIKEVGVQGHYFPTGRARTNVALATKQAKALRKRLILGCQDQAKAQIQSAKEEVDKLTAALQTAQRDHQDIAREFQAYKDTQKVLMAQEKAQAKTLKLREQRIAELEEELEELREMAQTTGFHLGQV